MDTRIPDNKTSCRAAALSILVIVPLVAASLTLESEAGGGGRRSGMTESCDEGTCEVSMTGRTFTPETLNIRLGATVIWSNDDRMPHTVSSSGSAEDTGLAFDSGILNPTSSGKQWEMQFDRKGTFDYICQLHPGMTGQVVVDGESVDGFSQMTSTFLVAAGVFGTFGAVASIKLRKKMGRKKASN
jgi:plastocyanin